MKTSVLLLISIFLFASVARAQSDSARTINLKLPLSKEEKKYRSTKGVAYTLLTLGILIGSYGAIENSKHHWGTGVNEMAGGAAAVLLSIPFFSSASKQKKKMTTNP